MGTAVTKVTPTSAATLPPAERKKFIEAFAGKLDRLTADQQSAFLMALGDHIGLRAELGELMIYQGKPYVTLDGRYRQAHSTGMLRGLDVRPATSLERRNYGTLEGVALWTAVAWRAGADRGFQGWGEAGGPKEKNVVAREAPPKMAKKRARYDALRAAFPVAEDITPMHREYIEEAEEAARLARGQVKPLASWGYDEAPDELEDEINSEIAADAEIQPGPAQPGAATPEQRDAIYRLAENKAVPPEYKKAALKHLEGTHLSANRAKNIIAFLETLINPPKAGAEAAEDGGLGLEDRRPSKSAVQAGL